MRASIVLALASAAAATNVLKRNVRRQGEAFDPDEIPVTGECSDLGPTYIECGPSLCIDPEAGETCCDDDCKCCLLISFCWCLAYTSKRGLPFLVLLSGRWPLLS